jgi:hypothetical protein
MLPKTTDGMKHVCYFRHALALDERRVKFIPEYAYGGASLPPDAPTATASATPQGDVDEDSPEHDTNVVARSLPSNPGRRSSDPKSTPNRPQTLEVWFAGTHSDMYVITFHFVSCPLTSNLVGVAIHLTRAWTIADRHFGG